MAAVRMDAGSVVRTGDHAENDTRVIASADVLRVGMRACGAHTQERQLFARRKDGQRTVYAVDIMRAGEYERGQLQQEGNPHHRVLLREGTALEHHGFKLLHDRIGFLKLLEEAKIRIFTENSLAVVVGILFAQGIQFCVNKVVKFRYIPCGAVGIGDFEDAERNIALGKGRVLDDFKHRNTSIC